MALNEKPVTKPDDGLPQCTAPHPVIPFLYFLGTLVLVALAIFGLARFL